MYELKALITLISHYVLYAQTQEYSQNEEYCQSYYCISVGVINGRMEGERNIQDSRN